MSLKPGRKKMTRPLPYPAYFLPVVFLALLGLIDSIYLFVSHYRVYTDMGYRSFCAITRSMNCDTVSQSPYSILWHLPVPVWGIFGYLFLLVFLFLSRDERSGKNRLWPLIFLLTLLYSLMSVFFAFVSTFYIGSYCILCIATYAINLFLLYLSWLIRRRFDPDSFFTAFTKDFKFLFQVKKKALCLFLGFFALATLTKVLLPAYWKMPAPPLSTDVSTGFTREGHPWIGAKTPVLTITAFSDYQCFQCRKMHLFLRRLVHEHPDTMRLVHRHFPMDHKFNPLVKTPFHVGSGEMALLAIFAATQNKFWETNDLLFELGRQKRPFNTKEIGEKTGLDPLALARARKDPAIRFRLKRDILEAIKLGIRATPAFLIDGNLYTAQIPSKILKKGIH